MKRFGGIQAVDGASFDVGAGSITALIGPNGAGKTTLFNVITGFYRGDRGVGPLSTAADLRPAALRDRAARHGAHLPDHEGARAHAGDRQHDAGGAATSPARGFATSSSDPRRSARREREVREQALELLELFDLQRLADEYAGTLSGGQRKLLELARALMAEPRMLLLDEPMAGINPTLGSAAARPHAAAARASAG